MKPREHVEIASGNIHMRGFDDMADAVEASIAELAPEYPELGGRKVWFGTHSAQWTGQQIPADAIVYNLEQWGAPHMTLEYIDMMSHRVVWDCSLRNCVNLRNIGVRANFVPVGYSAKWLRYASPQIGEITDVLHVGCMSERRSSVLSEIRQRMDGDVRIKALTCTYGDERDTHMINARIVLNVHYYDTSDMEEVRMGFLIANRKVVVSEAPTCETALLTPWVHKQLPIDEIPSEVVRMLGCPHRDLRTGAENDYKEFKKTSMTSNIRRALDESRKEVGI